MTRTEVIAIARDVGMCGMLTDVVCTIDELERFAALVAAKEREACAQVCDYYATAALFNWRSDLPSNQQFWNGAEQFATACSASIRAKDKP